MNVGEANDRLVQLINTAALTSMTLDDQTREYWHELVERDLNERCKVLRIEPLPYISYYHMQVRELEEQY